MKAATRCYLTMTTAAPAAPDTTFWQRCREEAAKTGRPAWLIAESWRHDDSQKQEEKGA